MTYVTDDDAVETVGSETGAGKMSPRWLLSTTIGDELRLHTNERARVIGLSLKDRGAILPAGHIGEAYWLDYATGTFVTSTYYRADLPDWVVKLNARDLVQKHLCALGDPVAVSRLR